MVLLGGRSSSAPPSLAVCTSGAVRSFLDPAVQASLEHRFLSRALDSHVLLFYHLFVGEELSWKGQTGVTDEQLHKLEIALSRATVVRLQQSENGYTCGNQATGRWFKFERCADSILNYELQRAATVDLAIFVRPDLLYTGRQLPGTIPASGRSDLSLSFDAMPTDPPWLLTVGSEILIMTYGSLPLVRNLTRAQCCNVSARTPDKCFWPGLDEPSETFMFRSHFSGLWR